MLFSIPNSNSESVHMEPNGLLQVCNYSLHITQLTVGYSCQISPADGIRKPFHRLTDQWFSTCGLGPNIIVGGPQMINLMWNIVFSLHSKQTNIRF